MCVTLNVHMYYPKIKSCFSSCDDCSTSFNKHITDPTTFSLQQTYAKMRLLHAQTKQFAEFFDQIPPYAILSHTWGSDELTFRQMEQKGYTPSKKIDGCCEQALKDDLKYVWIDTCCIDKSSSAELSEAINSMFNWYRKSEVCYAYLSDVRPRIKISLPDDEFPEYLDESRWFTRGWTLQELIAPKNVVFYDKSWNLIGRKSPSKNDRKFTRYLSKATQIDFYALRYQNSFSNFSVAQRMSWAAKRTTTRVEDTAYSLLGLFEINMPLLYGEGTRAFSRLQEEILKASDDESIFAWNFGKTTRQHESLFASLFASGPPDFSSCRDMIPSTPAGLGPSHYTLTNKGLYIETRICYLPIEGGIALVCLNCSKSPTAKWQSLAIVMVQSRENHMIFSRPCEVSPFLVPSDLFTEPGTHIYVHRSTAYKQESFFSGLMIQHSFGDEATYKIPEFYPPNWRMTLTHGTFVWHQPKNLESQHQDILFLVCHVEWPNFAVWLDYKFSLDSGLQPKGLKCRAAFVDKDKSLAEVLLRKRGTWASVEGALDWKEALYFEGHELSFQITKGEKPYGTYWTVSVQVNSK